ncbi:MAG: hypothetical protein ACR2KQ_03600 [Actinomycetota bacterium]
MPGSYGHVGGQGAVALDVSKPMPQAVSKASNDYGLVCRILLPR